MKNANNICQESIDAILNQLTLDEKIALCSGKNEWDTKEFKNKDGEVLIPSVKVSDGPHGLRKTVGKGDNLGLAASYPATCFPAESLVACSFDRDLVHQMGKSIAQEARQAGVCTILGPGTNIKRNPLCGRNFEYFSEDPYLSGQMASAYIDGAQSQGIGTSIKHFACNSQEYYRMTSNSRVNERTLREIYLSAFEYAIQQSHPATVMCAYNKINGTSCSDNEYLLHHILREEWGYKGLVVSDWGAVNSRIHSLKAGCDLIMPGGNAYEESDVKEAILNGQLDRHYLDRSARRMIEFALSRQQALMDSQPKYPTEFEMFDHSHQTAQRIAEQSAVLLKNDDHVLPLDVSTSEPICILGSMAKTFRFQGSGSSKINPTRTEQVLDAMAQYSPTISYADGYLENGDTNDTLLQEAINMVQGATRVILFAGLPEQYEVEGLDRHTMALPDGQNRLIEAISRIHSDVIVVLVCGCVVETPWIDHVKGLLWMGLSGQAGPSALARILFGQVNPSGKLAETWPICYQDCPSAANYLKTIDASYDEGLGVGYRFYDYQKQPVRFPFGYGLSYTKFNYGSLSVEQNQDEYSISLSVQNVGDRSGYETVLLFIENPQDGPMRPLKELKGFEKVWLVPGECKTITFNFYRSQVSIWNDGWVVPEGDYFILVGQHRVPIHIEGEQDISLHESEAFLQSKQTSEEATQEKYSKNSTISEVAQDVWLIRALYKWFEKKQEKSFGKGSAEYLSAMSAANECPLRAVQNMMGIKHHFAQAIADFGNKHFWAGIRHLFK